MPNPDPSGAARKFVEKWSGVELSERAASQEHFIDLCRLLDQPTPAEADPLGDEYTFEKPVTVVGAASKGSKGDRGFVDVWKKGRFAWEYKRKDKYKSLDEAYRQLYQYRDALDNPPLSIVCDIRHTEIRTHFPGYPPDKTVIRLEEVPAKLEVLRRAFANPDSFRATLKTTEQVTQELAREFSDLADRLIARYPPGQTLWDTPGDPVAHFLMKVMFCLFAEDIGLLPERVFTRMVDRCLREPENFPSLAGELFAKMKAGGWYGNDRIEYFNGGLFDDAAPLPLNAGELADLARAAARDWSGVEPTIFGTLFERILDPRKRAQIGAHYTGKQDILLVVEPVMTAPLRRRWEQVREALAEDLARHDAEPDRKKRDLLAVPVKLAIEEFRTFLGRQRVLDPACGSGNFLYVALQQLLDLEDEAVRFANLHEIYVDPIPRVRPTQMHGIEINRYAAELAQVVIWIGYLQWTAQHGIADPRRPILDKLQMIENRDAILDWTDKKQSKAAGWPEAEFIVGNPPFLGVRRFRDSGITDAYIQSLHAVYDIPKTSDLCCYWFEQGRRELQRHGSTRVGLLATQGIRSVDNREVLRRISESGAIFTAWSDQKWVLDGAAVRVSIIGFDGGHEVNRVLDGKPVERINADVTSDSDVTASPQLTENAGIAFMGDTKGGAFELEPDEYRALAGEPSTNGRATSEVLRPWINAGDITKRRRGMAIIDFGTDLSLTNAGGYDGPFKRVERLVKPERAQNRRETYAQRWWLHVEPRPAMCKAVQGLTRFLVTPRLAKHRLFVWVETRCLPDSRAFIFARQDDYFFGVLHSAVHELWSLRMCSWHGVGNDPTYNATTCFETFPLPWPPGNEDTNDPAYLRISTAAKELNERRERWLNPPEWVEPIAKRIDESDDFSDVPVDARPLLRQSAILAAAAKDPRLKNRTLTKLYNERPTWLKLAHEALDRAVLAAYAAADPAGGWHEEWAAAWLDTGAGQPLPAEHPLAAERAKADQAVLANLLWLNQLRAQARHAAAGVPGPPGV